MNRAPLIYLLFGAGLLLALCCSVSLLGRTDETAQEASVERELNSYYTSGLLRMNAFDQYKFVVPLRDYQFRVGSSPTGLLESFSREEATANGKGLVELDFFSFVERLGDVFTYGTRFSGRFNVNKPPLLGAINLYFVKGASLDNVYKNNCQYIGFQNAIICDADFIISQFQKIDEYKKTYDIALKSVETGEGIVINKRELDLVKQVIKQSLLIWIIGHEIGHAVNDRDFVISHGNLHFDLEYSPIEKRADTFVAEKLSQNKPLASQFWAASGEFVQQEYHRLYRVQHPDLGDIVLEDPSLAVSYQMAVPYNRYHIPLLLRGVRIINRILEISPEIDSTGYYEKVEANISVTDPLPYGRGFLVGFMSALTIGAFTVVILIQRSSNKGVGS